MPTQSQDFYAVLGLSKNVSQEEIKKAYRRLAREYHPDLHPGPKKVEMEQKFKELGEAHDVLKDPETRKKYDKYGANWKEAEVYEQGRQQAGGGQDGGGKSSDQQTGDFGKIFEEMFGAKTHRQDQTFRGFSMPGADFEVSVPLTLKEVVHGATRRLELPDEQGHTQKLDVRIPKGVLDGERVRVKGKGAKGMGAGRSGDLYLHVHFIPDRVFAHEGANIVVTLPIWPWEAVCGAEVQVPTLTGTVKLKVPVGAQASQRLRLRGKGLPRRSGSGGDQYVEFKIVTPEKPSDEEQALFAKLQEVQHNEDPRATLMREADHV